MRRWVITLAAVAGMLAAATSAQAAPLPTIPAQELRQIRALLRVFVPEAAGRHHPGLARMLATPAMRAQATPAQWRAGDLPVFPYPVNDGPYGIRPITVAPNEVTFDLMLHPRKGADAGVAVYTAEVQRIGGRWLVAEMFPTAQFAAPGQADTIVAQPDFAPHAVGLPFRNNLSQKIWLVVFAVIGLPLLAAPIGFLLVWRRSRTRGADIDAQERATAPWR
ncbi:MAG TPA: hypothetical protein VGL44_08505 [Gaiellales bacterium]